MVNKICLSLVIMGFVAPSIFAEVICPGVEVLDTGGITCEIIQDILNTHNELRENIAKGIVDNQPPAANMREMYWDDELAYKAQNWANHCTFQHNSATDRKVARFQVGQNMALTRTIGWSTHVIDFQSHIKSWFNEYIDYDFQPIAKSVRRTGHYTQIAWANSYLVGCGYSKYINNSVTYQLYVCNYGPAGNIFNAKPYIVGKKQKCPRHLILSEKFPHLCAEKMPSSACTSTDEIPIENSIEEKDIEKPTRRKLDDVTSNDKDFLNYNRDVNKKTKKRYDSSWQSLLRDIILSLTINI